MLIINPSWYPIWGIRNKLISNKLINIKDELSLNYLLLNSNYGNKINQLWYNRLNLVVQLASDESIKLKEFEIFYKFTSQNSRNYYYWNYLLQLDFSFNEFQTIYDKFLKLFLSNPFELGGFNCLLHYSITHFNLNKRFLLTLIENYPNLLILYSNNECTWSGYFLLLSSVKINSQLFDVQQVLVNQLSSLKIDKLNHVGEYWKLKCEMVYYSYESEDQSKTLKHMLEIKQSGHI
ncbi:hypothetical protein CONCODRAFT_19100 [Conidiobolus coronatus NRRL 28638]|uniref:Protein prenylyltransferase n=1 Tax=Conidiobolus coronatus (strain ATCC 28846 / CBS 209.66 / NRRL 28638) TaxID=796925 RepID=A0A137NZJ8_CONC2|nr:hypothetical protein CONCODRAFT_19100 [Conidiobolus coronatus NRRL 28638]|eukprot:KXN68263.1 hypothetical protein CONCODRAFT_19100 [Conidiobolus coronatus NRRL 28638]